MIVDNNTYFIAHNEKDIFHYGWVEEGQALDSGQPILERFASKSLFLARCSVLNIEINIEEITNIEKMSNHKNDDEEFVEILKSASSEFFEKSGKVPDIVPFVS
jgi:hypothetical protein